MSQALRNRGIGFGIAAVIFALDQWLKSWVVNAWGLVAVTGIIAIVVFVWLLRERLMIEIAGLALILGGALGNIRDRYDHGFVLDYADFHIGSFHPFLVINLADACITCGVLIILARALFMREKPAASQSGTEAEQAAEIPDA